MLRYASALLLCVSVSQTAVAHAEPAIEYLMVPSASMGRDIPLAFHHGGAHAVYLLDAFNAGDSTSNWVTAGGAMETLTGRGISVVAPAGGAYSFYTDWEQDSAKQWETFLSAELPDWLTTQRGLAPEGHAIIGAAQGGTAALTLAAFHPDRFRYAGSMSGFLTPGSTTLNGAISEGMQRYGGVDTRAMWGLPQLGRWKWHDPDAHVQLFIDNNTRLWVYSPSTLTCIDPAAMIGYCDQAQGGNRAFFSHYRTNGGRNGHFDIPQGGEHDWSSWRPQLHAMANDVIASIA